MSVHVDRYVGLQDQYMVCICQIQDAPDISMSGASVRLSILNLLIQESERRTI